MTNTRKKYEEYYGKSYEPKTLTEIKICLKCGRKIKDSKSRFCAYCGGTLKTKYIKKGRGEKIEK